MIGSVTLPPARAVVARKLRKVDRGLPVVIDVLSCGHEVVNAGRRVVERACKACPPVTINDELVRRAIATSRSVPAAAASLSITYRAMEYFRGSLQLPSPRSLTAPAVQQRREGFRSLHAKGLSGCAIARELKAGRATVHRMSVQLGLPLQGKPGRPRKAGAS